LPCPDPGDRPSKEMLFIIGIFFGVVMGEDSARRFDRRAASYARARPGYPEELLDHLFEKGVLEAGFQVADVGSGTGIFSKMLMDRRLTVYAIEPNEEMRREAERALGAKPGFRSIDGRAESTTLDNGSVDAVCAAQSFHWFDPPRARKEFQRILKPKRFVVLVWNQREVSKGSFVEDYDGIIGRYSSEHGEIDSRKNEPERIFQGSRYDRIELRHSKEYDLPTLLEYAISVSHLPGPWDPSYVDFSNEVREVFERHQISGKISWTMRATCCYGRLK